MYLPPGAMDNFPGQTIQRVEEIPVQNTFRKRTDVCCTVWAVLFGLTLLIWSIAGFNTGNLMKTNFPTDADGHLCGLDYPQHNFVYFANPEDPTARLCVKECPSSKGARLQCKQAGGQSCSHAKYASEGSDTRYGNYCLPKDEQLRAKILEGTGMSSRQGFVNAWDTIWFAFWLSLGLGFIWFLFVQFASRCANYTAVILGGIVLATLGLLLFTYRSNHHVGLKIFVALLALICGLVLLLCAWLYKIHLRLNAVVLYHSTRLIASNPSMLIYIPVFLLLALGLVALTIFELLAIWSIPSPQFTPEKPFYSPSGVGYVFLSALVFIQLYWGLVFLKEFFSFCISGNAVSWYFGRQACNTCISPVFRAFRYHFGSIVAGSFMIGFFTIPDALLDLIKPVDSNSKWGQCYQSCFGWLDGLFTLVRPDAMAYINVASLPYCNSARYCEFLCGNTRLYPGSQSITRYYRFGAHVLLAGIVTIIALFYRGPISVLAIIFIFFLSVLLVTYFISIHADAAEGLFITFLAEEYLAGGNVNAVQKCSPELLRDLKSSALVV